MEPQSQLDSATKAMLQAALRRSAFRGMLSNRICLASLKACTTMCRILQSGQRGTAPPWSLAHYQDAVVSIGMSSVPQSEGFEQREGFVIRLIAVDNPGVLALKAVMAFDGYELHDDIPGTWEAHLTALEARLPACEL